MIKILSIKILIAFFFPAICFSQTIPPKHNPKVDPNLSPTINKSINPEKNAAINPKVNWNINPERNPTINPDTNTSINPILINELNPNKNRMLNPMYHNELHPQNPVWEGLYVFNIDDELIGYISAASQNVILYFDTAYKWLGYFVKSGKGTYNFYNTNDQWTGQFGCYDGITGFNFFEKGGEWKGVHVK